MNIDMLTTNAPNIATDPLVLQKYFRKYYTEPLISKLADELKTKNFSGTVIELITNHWNNIKAGLPFYPTNHQAVTEFNTMLETVLAVTADSTKNVKPVFVLTKNIAEQLNSWGHLDESLLVAVVNICDDTKLFHQLLIERQLVENETIFMEM